MSKIKDKLPSARRFYFDGNIEKDNFEFRTDSYHKIKNVLRLVAGDYISVTDRDGNEFACRIVEFSSAHVLLEPANLIAKHSAILPISLGLALIKNERMDMAIEKICEFGIKKIIPFIADRSKIKSVSQNRHERWQRIAISAALQSGACRPAEISKVKNNLPSIFEENEIYSNIWHLDPEGCDFKKILGDTQTEPNCKELLILIGPEGGWSDTEINFLSGRSNGISIGASTFRTETAAIIACFCSKLYLSIQ